MAREAPAQEWQRGGGGPGARVTGRDRVGDDRGSREGSPAGRWWTVAAVCLGTFMLLLDISAVYVALPSALLSGGVFAVRAQPGLYMTPGEAEAAGGLR
jgi:hypothetical protein